MTRQYFLLAFCCSLLLFLPCTGSAQTPPAEAEEVAVMVFVGDDLALSAVLRDATVNEVQGLGGYGPRLVSAEEFPETSGFPPDEPPAPTYLGTSKYVLTGEFYTDLDEEIGHFQLWLWNSGDGSLVYTDELVAGDIDEALGYMPTLVNWIFSRIPKERTAVAEQSSRLTILPGEPDTPGELDTPGEPDTLSVPGPRNEVKSDPLNRWLYLGLRAGGSFRFYTLPELTKDYHTDLSSAFSWEASFHAAFRFLPFMSIQAEAVYTQDTAPFRGPEYYESGTESWHLFYTDNYSSASLMFGGTIKFPLVFDPYIISPFGGVYWVLPLGWMSLESTVTTRKAGVFDYGLTGHLGLTLGVDVGIRLGPGILFVDARYAGDFGEIVVQMDGGTTIKYKRAMLSFSVGYEFALADKKRPRAGGNK